MKITRLRLLGFKSFVEPAELLVEPGLTGVVGPNGCGKSNLLEALRWVMGETSHKSMRGASMDDVVFAGTQSRPARNMAEVTIFLDNSQRKAPAEFNDSDQLEISRRIEREAGSVFRINGKDVRARDVRLLFEDAATGARSPALVRQGRIGEIVNANPQQRRRVLEDAAGIAGLHSRRHEAELRLKGAENNLERLRDLMGQIKTQVNSLKRQARQARRYKEMSGEIRRGEALQYHLRWNMACQNVEAEEAALEQAVRGVAQLTQNEAQAILAHTKAADEMQPLREEEAARGAVLHRLNVEQETLEREEERAQARKQELEDRLAQLNSDLERETEREREAAQALARLKEEEEGLANAPDPSNAAAAAREEMEARASEREESESALSLLTGRLADLRAERQQLSTAASSEQARIDRLEARDREDNARLIKLESSPAGTPDISGLRTNVSEFSNQASKLEERVLEAENALAALRNKENAARETATEAKLHAQELETEAQTLVKLLKPAEGAKWIPVVGKMRVESGYELALGAALGDDLDASDDAKAPARWESIAGKSSDPGLPEGAEPLGKFVKAPKALARRLAQIGIVTAKRGDALQGELQPGQRLVSKSGDLWRWDGYSAAADAPTASARRLAERNRLDALTAEAEAARGKAKSAEELLGSICQEVSDAEAEDREASLAWRGAQGALGAARDELATAERAAQASSKELGALAESGARTREALEEARAALKTAQTALEKLEPESALDGELEALQEDIAAKRSAYADARLKNDGIEREQQILRDRIAAVSRELDQWSTRLESAARQIETLRDRFEETRAEVDAFTDFPDQIEKRRTRLLDEIGKAEKARRDAADALSLADTTLRDRDKAMRQAQSVLAETREDRARIEARLEAARERRAEQARMISEQLECAPEECLSVAQLEPGSPTPELQEIDERIAKLKADREHLGGVNLGAEKTLEDITGELETMSSEQEDLEEAIARLRQGISKLNREGRKRLLDAFEEVNGHFQNLFKTLFGGGEAELQLIESDDPLESGLEILARPPGKKPQVLTLLSGGEKALTALALIFAVFLTNPSPICVLDEVDAPLDDSNVERFCRLMEEMRKATDTRFLIITHHPVTMSRMDRLFGVTMAERGVSQLVSVDLETAEQFRDTG